MGHEKQDSPVEEGLGMGQDVSDGFSVQKEYPSANSCGGPLAAEQLCGY